MDTITSVMNSYLPYIIIGLSAAFVIITVLLICAHVKLGRLKKRYEFFMGANRRPDHNLETKLQDYMEKVNGIDAKYGDLVNIVRDMNANIEHCTQKIGIIRYNPFDEMGGNLCFAVALLDADDNGVVLNGIHTRTGSFTYAKPIERGVSTYVLSAEEIQAIDKAKENAHIAIDRTVEVERKIKIYKVKVPQPTKRKREEAPGQMELDINQAADAVSGESKGEMLAKDGPKVAAVDKIYEENLFEGRVSVEEESETGTLAMASEEEHSVKEIKSIVSRLLEKTDTQNNKENDGKTVKDADSLEDKKII